MIAYHFVNKKLRDGRPIPKDGEWLVHKGELKMCASGLHASLHPFDALQHAPGNTLCLVEVDGKIIYGDDKLVAEKRMITRRFDAEALLFKFARDCALSVIHLWDAPEVVKEFLTTGNETLRDAARSAAWDATGARAAAAAGYAAWTAAKAATGAAARDAASRTARSAAWDAARAATGARAAAAAWDAAREKQRVDFKQVIDDLA